MATQFPDGLAVFASKGPYHTWLVADVVRNDPTIGAVSWQQAIAGAPWPLQPSTTNTGASYAQTVANGLAQAAMGNPAPLLSWSDQDRWVVEHGYAGERARDVLRLFPRTLPATITVGPYTLLVAYGGPAWDVQIADQDIAAANAAAPVPTYQPGAPETIPVEYTTPCGSITYGALSQIAAMAAQFPGSTDGDTVIGEGGGSFTIAQLKDNYRARANADAAARGCPDVPFPGAVFTDTTRPPPPPAFGLPEGRIPTESPIAPILSPEDVVGPPPYTGPITTPPPGQPAPVGGDETVFTPAAPPGQVPVWLIALGALVALRALK